jgi:hypothetical protein
MHPFWWELNDHEKGSILARWREQGKVAAQNGREYEEALDAAEYRTFIDFEEEDEAGRKAALGAWKEGYREIIPATS